MLQIPFVMCTFVGDGYLKRFLAKTRTMSPEERGAYLEKDEVQQAIGVAIHRQ